MPIKSKITSNRTQFNQYRAPSDPGIGGEDNDGFAIAMPLSTTGAFLFAFRWVVRVEINGQRGDPCERVILGVVQNVVKYGATVKWQSGTAWRWSMTRLPARDAVDGNSAWYNKDFTFKVARCGLSVEVEHGDSPTLIKQRFEPMDWIGPPTVIPWADPRTGAPDSVVSLIWTAGFDAFLMMQHPDNGGAFSQVRDANGHALVTGWGLDVEIRFDMKMPVGHRSRLISSAVGPRPFSHTLPKTTGPLASINLKQSYA